MSDIPDDITERWLAEIERLLRLAIEKTNAWKLLADERTAERDELLAALREIEMLPGTDPVDPFLADQMSRIARTAIAKAEKA